MERYVINSGQTVVSFYNLKRVDVSVLADKSSARGGFAVDVEKDRDIKMHIARNIRV